MKQDASNGGAADDEDSWTEVATKPRGRRTTDSRPSDSRSQQADEQNFRPPLRQRPGQRPGGYERPDCPQDYRDLRTLERQVIVEGLTAATTDSLLASAFREPPQMYLVDWAQVQRENNGVSRGWGTVTFSNAGTAAMAARDKSVRVDGKLCYVRLVRPRRESGGAQQQPQLFVSKAEAKDQVKHFINRYEVAGGAQMALLQADPKTALRAIRALESWGRNFNDKQIHSELQRVMRCDISRELEERVSGWVRSTNLSETWQESVEGVLLAQRSEEIEHILEAGQTYMFHQQLCSKVNPTAWLLSQVQRYSRQQVAGDIQTFCHRFNFDQQTEWDLSELSAQTARRLMQDWQPAGLGTPQQRHQRFLTDLAHAVSQLRKYREERNREQEQVSAVASHARIIQEWSDDEEDGETFDRPDAGQDDGFDAIDTNTEAQEHTAAHNHASSSAEQFIIHSTQESITSAQQSQSRTSAQRLKAWQPKATHFVLCVDTSGSMATRDCTSAGGWTTSRLEAVLETCQCFVSASKMTPGDLYSFVTFNEQCLLHFSCLKAVEANVKLKDLQPMPQCQTLYAMGIRGIEAAIRRDKSKLHAHVVFLSDGEPTDPGTYNHDLHVLRRKHVGTLRIYTVGFGESAKVNSREEDFIYLQQLASVGRGHFQRCGASLSSLQGAFTALSSTISHTRTSTRRRSSARCSETMPGDGTSKASSSAEAAPCEGAGRSEGPHSSTVPMTIDELSEESEEDSGGESDRGQMLKAEGKSIVFELPFSAEIFTKVSDEDKWRSFTAAQTSFRFDGKTFTRRAAVEKVYLRRKPFMQGGMRLVYGMVLEKGAKQPSHVSNMMCAKRLFQDRGIQAHAAFCKCTAVATYFGKQMRAATAALGKRVQLGFMDLHLYSPVGENEGGGFHFCGESWLKGHFVKLNSNNGFVNESDYGEHSAIAQAFSHFTFDRSYGELMVVDLQGVCGDENGVPYCLLTDPQVHSRGSYERFGRGDLGDDGICAFFQKHKCGELCAALKLRKECNLRAPTHTLPMPGVDDCIRNLCNKAFLMDVRKKSGVSSICVPREAFADWLEVRVWATQKGGDKAMQALRGRLAQYYQAARAVVPVEPVPAWDADQWHLQLDAWRRESASHIIAFPKGWEQGGAVKEVWIFAKQVGWNPDRYDLETQSDAYEIIQRALQNAQNNNTRRHASGQQNALPHVAETWAQYQDRNTCKYWWYREPDGLWFYESDKDWQRFHDEASKSYWWWQKEKGTWFFEPQR